MKTADVYGNAPFEPGTYGVPYRFSVHPGISSHQRIGNALTFKKLRVMVSIYPDGTNVTESELDVGRVVIVYDRAVVIGSWPPVAEIYTSITTDGVEICTSMSPQNPREESRFLVLLDHTFTLPPLGVHGANPTKNAGVVLSGSECKFEGMIDLSGLEQIGTPDPGYITTGALLIFGLCDAPGSGTIHHAWRYRWDIRQFFTE